VSGLATLRLGLARGGIELRQTLTYWPDLFQFVFFSGIQILVLFLLRGHHVPGANFSLGAAALPSLIGMSFVFSGVLGVTALLCTDREDGTLLRAKATPGGMTAYVIGKITNTSGCSRRSRSASSSGR
jgi:ABC-2 type transport system permease protein